MFWKTSTEHHQILDKSRLRGGGGGLISPSWDGWEQTNRHQERNWPCPRSSLLGNRHQDRRHVAGQGPAPTGLLSRTWVRLPQPPVFPHHKKHPGHTAPPPWGLPSTGAQPSASGTPPLEAAPPSRAAHLEVPRGRATAEERGTGKRGTRTRQAGGRLQGRRWSPARAAPVPPPCSVRSGTTYSHWAPLGSGTSAGLLTCASENALQDASEASGEQRLVKGQQGPGTHTRGAGAAPLTSQRRAGKCCPLSPDRLQGLPGETSTGSRGAVVRIKACVLPRPLGSERLSWLSGLATNQVWARGAGLETVTVQCFCSSWCKHTRWFCHPTEGMGGAARARRSGLPPAELCPVGSSPLSLPLTWAAFWLSP